MSKITSESVKKIKNNINEAWKTLTVLAKQEEQDELIEGFVSHIKQMNAGIFRLVVMGEIKKGKSSFINALLGEEDLLPTASDVATSTVYKVIYGPKKRIKVYFLPDIDTGKYPPPLEIVESQLPDYGTESGNPDNEKHVDFIAVELPNDLLKTGLIIVDTPGVGGLFKKHKDITWKYAPNADAIFFVLDSTETVISQNEINFLQDLTEKITKRIYFIQTKIDIPGEEQWQTWEKRNKEILLEKLKISPSDFKYFPVSSKLKQRGDKKQKERFIEDSRFPVVLDFLKNDLIARKDIIICKEISKSMISFFTTIKNGISKRAEIARANTKEKLAQLEENNRQLIQKIVEWEQTVYKETYQDFLYTFQEIKEDLFYSLKDSLNPYIIVPPLIDVLREKNVCAEEINKKAGELQHKVLDISLKIVMQKQEEFNEKISDIVQEYASKLTISLGELELTSSNRGINANIAEGFNVPIQNTLNMQFSSFDNMRQTLYGTMAGSMMGSIATGILTFVFPPAGAVSALLTFGGAIMGGCKAAEIAQQRQQDQALQKLEQLLTRTVIQIQDQACRQLKKMSTASEKNIKELFDKALHGEKNKLEKQSEEINNAKHATAEEMQKIISEAGYLLKTIDSAVELIAGI